MKKILMPAVPILFMASMIFFASCDLLYPPAFYNNLVNSEAKNKSSSSVGPKSWVLVTQHTVASAAYPQIKTTSSGNPIVVCPDMTFVHQYDGTWQTHSQPSFDPFSLDLDSAGTPFMASALNYGTVFYGIGSWGSITTSISVSSVGSISLAIGVANSPAVAYSDLSGNLYTAYWNGSTWNTSATPIVGSRPKIAYSQGNYFFSFETNSAGLYVGKSASPTSFPSYTSLTPNPLSIPSSMASGGGKAYIAYEFSGTFNVVSYDGAAVTPLPFNTPNTINSFSIAANDYGQVYIALLEYVSPDSLLNVYSWDGSSWSQAGGTITNIGANLSLAVAPDGTPFLAYGLGSGEVYVMAYK